MNENNDRPASGFRYPDVLRRGRPVHDPQDAFSSRHPSMPLSRRAKIFSPFDALKGFSEALREKERQHMEHMEHMEHIEHIECMEPLEHAEPVDDTD